MNMNQLDTLKKFGTPCSFSDMETKRLNQPPTTFYLLSTHLETSLPLEVLVKLIEDLFQDDTFPFRTTLRGTETVLNDTGYSWKMRQENIPESFCDEIADETYCSTSINVYRKKNCSGVYIVEAVHLNGNRNLFHENWHKVQNAFPSIDL